MNRLAVQALEKMETRKFNSKSKGRREGSCGALDTLSSGSTSDCAICLEKYIDGEVAAETGLPWVGRDVQGPRDAGDHHDHDQSVPQPRFNVQASKGISSWAGKAQYSSTVQLARSWWTRVEHMPVALALERLLRRIVNLRSWL